jgi:hypothetical protein
VKEPKEEETENMEQKKTISLYINNTWVHQEGRNWIAKAVAFSENGNDVTISACDESPKLAYRKLVAGMKELRLLPEDWEE